MNTYPEVIRFVNRVQPGQTATVSVRRDGEDKSVRVTFATREQVYGNDERQANGSSQNHQQRGRQHFSQQGGNWEHNDLNPSNQSRRGNYRGRRSGEHGVLGIDLENESGNALIRDVRSGSPAQQAGLRRGDEIVAIDGQNVRDRQDVMDDLHDRQPGERVSLTSIATDENEAYRLA